MKTGKQITNEKINIGDQIVLSDGSLCEVDDTCRTHFYIVVNGDMVAVYASEVKAHYPRSIYN